MVRVPVCRSLLITLSLLLTGMATAQPTERRVALVIGNGQYHHVPRLANPTRDARLMADTLERVGFTLVGGTAHLDLDKTAFDRLVQEFGTVIQGAGVALFYLTFRTLFCTSGGILEEPSLEGGAGAMLRLFDAL